MGLGVWGLEFVVCGLGFGVWGLRFWFWDLVFGFGVFGVAVQGLEFRVYHRHALPAHVGPQPGVRV